MLHSFSSTQLGKVSNPNYSKLIWYELVLIYKSEPKINLSQDFIDKFISNRINHQRIGEINIISLAADVVRYINDSSLHSVSLTIYNDVLTGRKVEKSYQLLDNQIDMILFRLHQAH